MLTLVHLAGLTFGIGFVALVIGPFLEMAARVVG
jgi:hypothetical protein